MSAPLSWAIMLVFGLQSLLYYSLLTWLPSIWVAAGFSQVAASTLTTVFQFAGLPFSLLVPTLAYRHHGEAIVVAISAGGYLLGVLGILFSGTNFTANVVAALIAGCGSGAAFNLAIILFQKKSCDGGGYGASIRYVAVFGVLVRCRGTHFVWTHHIPRGGPATIRSHCCRFGHLWHHYYHAYQYLSRKIASRQIGQPAVNC